MTNDFFEEFVEGMSSKLRRKIHKGLRKHCNGDRVRGIEAFARKGAKATYNTYYRAP